MPKSKSSMIGKVLKINEKQAVISFADSYSELKAGEFIKFVIVDKNTITTRQRKKIFALCREIANYSGHDPEWIRQIMRFEFLSDRDFDYFSLSTCSKRIAKEFIEYLIEFCIRWDIPTRDWLGIYAEDIKRYVYVCLKYKKCCICGKRAQLHHCEGDRVGMGRNRYEVPTLNKRSLPLCSDHHGELHTMPESEFLKKYSIEPVLMDKICLKQYKKYKE